jgi:predicted nucleic acid-binding protein
VIHYLPDTSCLVAAACSWHEHHEATAADVAARAGRREKVLMAAPVLLEAYAVLTRLPPPYRLKPGDALAVLEGSWGDAKLVAVPPGETWSLLRTLPERGIAGGGSYDAMIVACARRARADVILTWNVRHFERLAEDIDVMSPGSG